MDLDPDRCYRALSSRDERFDGRFFVAVITTGIYCRPVCPARTPRRRNVLFYASAAAAGQAGFRPCLRCRPETSPGTPAWRGTSATVTRALRLLEHGALDGSSVEGLAGRLGIGERHLRRLFREQLGASPVAVAQTRRLHFAKKLIDETPLPMTEVAFAAGYSSLRRFNAALRGAYGVPPSDLRRARSGASNRPSRPGGPLRLRLAARRPFAAPALLDFLAARAIPGVEHVEGNIYRRTVCLNGVTTRIGVQIAKDQDAVELSIEGVAARSLGEAVGGVRRLFDLDADPEPIARVLRADPLLARTIRRTPGLRVPGAWDGFELAVRAVLGQQVSVAGASTLAGRLVERFGTPLADAGDPALTHVFPTPDALAEADVARIGMPAKRAEAIRGLARAVAIGHLVLGLGADPDASRARLLELPGFGPWTADYIAMRALREPDAFPSGDLVLRRVAAGGGKPLTPRALEVRSLRWQPWRAYAAIALWRSTALG
jgi:AraC family transcriptional regulator of adaptative response / DNA-3-methyladenine glycosylase II